jgi:hypothetical protein
MVSTEQPSKSATSLIPIYPIGSFLCGMIKKSAVIPNDSIAYRDELPSVALESDERQHPGAVTAKPGVSAFYSLSIFVMIN